MSSCYTAFLNANKLVYFKGYIKVKTPCFHWGIRQQDNTSCSHFSFSHIPGRRDVKTEKVVWFVKYSFIICIHY